MIEKYRKRQNKRNPDLRTALRENEIKIQKNLCTSLKIYIMITRWNHL